jgi:hypothetical protein
MLQRLFGVASGGINSTFKRIDMPLKAYLDDSGTHTNDSPVCVAAGYFGGAHYWKQFDLDWQKAVEDHGLTEFHASRFWSGGLGGKTKGDYASWSKNDCEEFLDELLTIIGRDKIWLSAQPLSQKTGMI